MLNIPVLPQILAGEKLDFEPRFLIDMPTSGVLKKGYVSVGSDLMPGGVLLTRLDVGVFDNLSFGISYGGENIIGTGDVTWYKYPGVNIRFKIIEESLTLPSITVGADLQGKGRYFSDEKRYEIKSPGLFAAVSKNYRLLGYMSIHGAISYSFEQKDGDNFANLAVGVEKTIGSSVSVLLEYNFAFNDNSNEVFGKGNGYLHAGVRWAVAEGFSLGFDFRDLLNNKKWSPNTADRGIKFEFVKKIL
ncbi:MAG: hypothetical protein B6D45_04570 [Ignavibacteriales bacterium UTCHB3]|nr:YjbH domain-containing protein [Ignavibacteriaceae bacterium]OQY76099.1 MAG: hypothetical protein B6D45_04570 [Ignavibacteriales bacterium UTCHB3]